MAKTKAYVTSDGEVLSAKAMDKYMVDKEGSKQLAPDTFGQQYDRYGLIKPIYSLEALAQLMETNSYHYRAVKTKARDVAGLGWTLEPREDIEGEPSESQKQVALQLLNRPNADSHLEEINDRVMVDYEATGNGYHEIIRDEQGNVVAMEHIPAQTMRRHADLKRYVQKRGQKHIWFKAFGLENDVDYENGDIYDLGTLSKERKANEILHISNYTSRSDYYGIPDIMPAMGALLGDREREEYNISFFENHAVPAYAVTVSGADLDDETVDMIERFFKQDVKESRNSTLVLTAQKDEADDSAEPIEFNFQALSTETKEASFEVYRQDNRDEILSAHGVPPYRAGITVEGQMGGSSAGESTEIYKQSVIKPRQEVLENQITRHILEEGLEVTDWIFKFKEIDNRDIEQDIKRMESIFAMGALSPNMILEELGRETIDDPNMDKHFIDGQPIEQLVEGQPDGMQGQAMMNAVKELHSELAQMATKEKRGKK